MENRCTIENVLAFEKLRTKKILKDTIFETLRRKKMGSHASETFFLAQLNAQNKNRPQTENFKTPWKKRSNLLNIARRHVVVRQKMFSSAPLVSIPVRFSKSTEAASPP